MLQFFIVLFVSLFGSGLAGYSDSDSRNDINNDNFGVGYSGSFSGLGNPPFNFQIPTFDFSSFMNQMRKFQEDLQKNILAQARIAENTVAQSSSSFPSVAAGGAVTGGGGYGGGYSAGGTGQSYGGSFSGSNGFQFPDISNGASAFGAIGPNGIQQRAGVFPENPTAPNVNVQFPGQGDGPGFKSVFTSSSSFTSNVDGQPKTVKQATTTVNDNGKVTTYTAKSP